MSETRGDIAAAKARMRSKVGGGREIKRLENHLHGGETVERMTTGQYGNGVGLLVLTDRRLLFVKDGLLAQASEDFPLAKVSSVQWAAGMAQGTITVYASGNTAEITRVVKDDGKDIVDLMRARLAS